VLLRRRSQIVFFFLLASACAVVAESVPFELRGGYLIVARCSAANTPDLTAILDTGVTETVVDIALARRLNLQMHPDSAIFVNGEGSVQAVSIPLVRLGPLEAESIAGIAVDLSGLKTNFGIHPDLLIGMDLLKRSSVTVDYKSRLLTFGPIPPMAHTAPLIEGSRLPLITAAAFGQAVRLQIDTGINGLVLYANRFRMAENSHEIGARLVGVSRTMYVQRTDVDLRIGDCRERQIAASVIENSAVSEFDGLIGAPAFAKRRLAFDFEKMLVAWE